MVCLFIIISRPVHKRFRSLVNTFCLDWWNTLLKCHVSLVNVRLQRPVLENFSIEEQSTDNEECQSDAWPEKTVVISSISNDISNSARKLENISDDNHKFNNNFHEVDTGSMTALSLATRAAIEMDDMNVFLSSVSNTLNSFPDIKKSTVTNSIPNAETLNDMNVFSSSVSNTLNSFPDIKKSTVTNPIPNAETFAPVIRQSGQSQTQNRSQNSSHNEKGISSKNCNNCFEFLVRKLFCCCF